MNQRSLSFLPVLLLASVPALLSAQETTGMEDERMQEIARYNEQEWAGPKNRANVGFRLLNSGGTISYGNLGTIPAKSVAPASEGAVDRVYDNGYVAADAARANEVDADGNQISTPGGRYPIYVTGSDGTKIQVGEGLGYEPGFSREWHEYSQAQLDARPGYVAMTNYSTTSEGGHLSDETEMAAGVEMEYARNLGRISRRIQWGFVTGLTLNSINSQSSGSILATLNSRTDYYLIKGNLPSEFPTGGHGGPTGGPYVVDGVILSETGMETTVPVSQTPDAVSDEDSVAGGATVNGRWTVKGAYFMVKLGPSIRAQFSDRWEMTASAGFAGAYAGSTYTSAETFTLEGLPPGQVPGVQDILQDEETAFLTGYFADLTIEWAANDRTGLFGGVTAQQLSDYEQKLGDRTARVDLGTAVGVRGGITIKF